MKPLLNPFPFPSFDLISNSKHHIERICSQVLKAFGSEFRFFGFAVGRRGVARQKKRE